MVPAVLEWWRRRKAVGRAVRADASSLVDLLGADGAYHEARQRARLARTGAVVDHDRPPRHWTRVSIEIIRRSPKKVGLDTATRYLER